MSGFDLHKITHSSPSAINLWASSREAWVRQKLFFEKTVKTPAMWRGILAEEAILGVLLGGDEGAAIRTAVERFDYNLAFYSGEVVETERFRLAEIIGQGVFAMGAFGAPDILQTGQQHKIKTVCRTAAWALDVIGYLDLIYHRHRLIFDIKTVSHLPKAPPVAHARQAAIYKHAMPGYKVFFLYLAPRKSNVIEMRRPDNFMPAVKNILIEQEAFLSGSPDRDILLEEARSERLEKQGAV